MALKEIRLRPVWRGMKRRCYCPDAPKYKYYGERGIAVCEEWRNDFQAFYTWALANGYREGLSLDRKNVDGNYEPDNCRWVSITEQNGNKRNNCLLTYGGETRSIPQWSAVTGISTKIIYARIHYHGWSVEDALTIPTGQRR